MENSQIDWFFPCGKSPANPSHQTGTTVLRLRTSYMNLTATAKKQSCTLILPATLYIYDMSILFNKLGIETSAVQPPPPSPFPTVTNLPTSVNKTQFLTPSTRLANNILDSFVLFGGIAARKQLECSFKWYFAAKFPWWMDKIVKECTK